MFRPSYAIRSRLVNSGDGMLYIVLGQIKKKKIVIQFIKWSWYCTWVGLDRPKGRILGRVVVTTVRGPTQKRGTTIEFSNDTEKYGQFYLEQKNHLSSFGLSRCEITTSYFMDYYINMKSSGIFNDLSSWKSGKIPFVNVTSHFGLFLVFYFFFSR